MHRKWLLFVVVVLFLNATGGYAGLNYYDYFDNGVYSSIFKSGGDPIFIAASDGSAV